MVAVPGVTSATTPVEPTVATEALSLLHVPPLTASLSVILNCGQLDAVPVMPGIEAITFTEVAVVQPVGSVYIIAAVPAETPCPVTIPVVEPTVAREVLLLLHVPPPAASDKLRLAPEQTEPLPVMAAGSGLTVTIVLTEHPAAVTLMVTVVVTVTVPAVTMPVEPTAAMPEALLLHTTPGVPSVSVVLRPEHTLVVPVMLAGSGLTVKPVEAIHVPSV